jgi:hypothetical protein
MTQERLTEYGVTLLRVSLGVMYLAHSILLELFPSALPVRRAISSPSACPDGWPM